MLVDRGALCGTEQNDAGEVNNSDARQQRRRGSGRRMSAGPPLDWPQYVLAASLPMEADASRVRGGELSATKPHASATRGGSEVGQGRGRRHACLGTTVWGPVAPRRCHHCSTVPPSLPWLHRGAGDEKKKTCASGVASRDQGSVRRMRQRARASCMAHEHESLSGAE